MAHGLTLKEQKPKDHKNLEQKPTKEKNIYRYIERSSQKKYKKQKRKGVSRNQNLKVKAQDFILLVLFINFNITLI